MNKFLNAFCKKTMLAAVQAPLMSIYASFLHQTCIAGLVKHTYHILDASLSEWHLGKVLSPTENE